MAENDDGQISLFTSAPVQEQTPEAAPEPPPPPQKKTTVVEVILSPDLEQERRQKEDARKRAAETLSQHGFHVSDKKLDDAMRSLGRSAVFADAKKTEFSFTLTIDPTHGIGTSATGSYTYTITSGDTAETKTGRLLLHTLPEGVDKEATDLQAKEDGTWDFTLKGGQTMAVNGLPVDTGYTYKVEETTTGEGYAVTDSDTEADNTDKTVSGKIEAGSKDPVQVTFTNTKRKPEPVTINLALTKTVTETEGTFTWTDQKFTFLVMPDEHNPVEDPIKVPKEVMVSNPIDGSNTNTVDNIFDGLQFEKAGTYVYTVTEQVSTVPGISSDGKAYTVKVVVSEDYGSDPDNPVYTGRLTVEVSVTPNEAITFTNPYEEGRISVPLRARKQFNDVLTEGLFTFELTGVSAEYNSSVLSIGNFEEQNGLDVDSPQADEEQNDPEQDPPPVGENEPDSGEPSPISNSEGGLDTGIMPMAAPPKPDYVGIPPIEGGASGPWKQRNTADGWVDFGKVTFDQAGTYIYTLREIAGEDVSIRYSKAVYKITITIKMEGSKLAVGSVKYEVSLNGDGNYEPWDGTTLNVPLFINERQTGSLAVYKTVTDAGDQTKDFQFTVTFVPTEGLEDATITKFGVDGSPVAEEFTIDSKGELKFTLKHGEHLEILWGT